MTWLLAPACSATAVRDPLVEIGEALEEAGGDVGRAHADHLLVGVDLVAAPRREAVAVAMVSVSETRVMPSGGDEQRPDVGGAVHGTDGRRARPAGARR